MYKALPGSVAPSATVVVCVSAFVVMASVPNPNASAIKKTSLSGEQVYNARCAACHAAGILQSPKLGDKDAWKARLSQGLDKLVYSALNGKGIRIKYKIVRGTLDRTGEFVISASTTAVSFDDTFTESGSSVGVTLTAVLDDKDSTSGSETVAFKFTTTSSGTDATIDYSTTIIA